MTNKDFLTEFRINHGWISFEISDEELDEFLERSYIKDLSIDGKMDIFKDFLIANDLCEVQL